MAETLVSPGVLARETDQSFLTQVPVEVGAAIIGPTVKGPVNIPTVVTTYGQYQNIFGTTFVSASNSYSFLTSIAAYNYFNAGGDSLLVARVVTGSYTSATSSINAGVPVGTLKASGSGDITQTANFGTVADDEVRFTHSGTTYRFVAADPGGGGLPGDQAPLYFVATGSTQDAFVGLLATKISESLSSSLLTGIDEGSGVLAISASAAGTALNDLIIQTGSISSFGTAFTLGGGAQTESEQEAFQLETIGEGLIMNSTCTEASDGALLDSGSSDNIRWAVTNRNTGSGTFTLIIRRGDDKQNDQNVLETYNNLSLDPYSPNFISNIIGDQKQVLDTSDSNNPYIAVSGSYPNGSTRVRVKSVSLLTPNYLDNSGNPKSEYTASIPSLGSGSFGGAEGAILGTFGTTGNTPVYEAITTTDKGAQGIAAADYSNMLSLLANQDAYNYNVLSLPGVIDGGDYASTVTTAINNTQVRGDALLVTDMSTYGATVANVVNEASARDTSYAATYWPWLMVQDPDMGKNVWVPASTLIPSVYAFTDNSSAPWFAPAGLTRGSLGGVVGIERILTQGQRDTLYDGKVNPIASFPGSGVVVYGQKTLQTKASALDRVNVRRLLIAVKGFISQVANNLVFEQNTAQTRNSFLAAVEPYLETVQQQQGLYAFRVIMDDSNNTPDVIDRNQLIGQIYLQPTKTAEFIYLDFNILPTGATFPA